MKSFKANFILGKKQIVLASLVLILGVAVYLNWQFANSNDDLTATNTLALEEDADKLTINSEDLVVDETAAEAEKTAADPTALTGEDALKLEGKLTKSAKDGEAVTPQNIVKDSAKIASADTAAGTDAAKTKNLGDTMLVSSKSIADETYFAMAKLARTRSRDEAIDTISTVLNDEKLTDDDKKDVSAKAISITDIIETESRIENLIKSKGFSECVVYITTNNANVVVKTDGLDQDSATQIKNIIASEGKIAGENISITEIA